MTDGVRQAVDLLETGDADGAARVCRQILQQDARNHQAMILLGQIVAGQWRHDEALELLARAVSLAPKNADYHVKLAEALTTQGRQREALLRYDKALRLKADFPAALAGKAEVHVLSGQRQKARGMLEPFVEAGTESAAMAAVYALIVTRDGDHDRAVEVASRHVDDETFWPLRQNLWFRIGDAQEAAGRYDDAFDAYTHGNRTNPAS